MWRSRVETNMQIIFFLFFFVFGNSFAEYSAKDLKCLVCKASIKEMVKEIEKVNPNKKIQVGSFRLDDSGNLQQQLVPFARSRMHLSELMDEVCKSMQNYARATDKKTRELKLLKLLNDEGGMNPEMSEVDFVQDSDLNESLSYYCEGILEEFEDEVFDVLKDPSEDPVSEICIKETNLCKSVQREEL